MKKLLTLAIVAMAFVIPAPASADMFSHEGGPVPEEGVETTFSGQFAFALAAEPMQGFHCEVHIYLRVTTFEAHGTGAQLTNCTTTPGGLKIHATASGGSSWMVTTDGTNIYIENLSIHNKVTHPTIPNLVVAESTSKGGKVIATPDNMEAIGTLSLSDEDASIQVGVPPAGEPLSANLSGDLLGDETIGIE